MVPCFGFGWHTTWVPAEMGESMLPDPTLAVDTAPSPAGVTPTPVAAEPGVTLAPPPSAAATTSPGATNMDLLGGQWASGGFPTTESLLDSSTLHMHTQEIQCFVLYMNVHTLMHMFSLCMYMHTVTQIPQNKHIHFGRTCQSTNILVCILYILCSLTQIYTQRQACSHL